MKPLTLLELALKRKETPPLPPPMFAYNQTTHVASNTIQRCAKQRRTYKKVMVIKIQSILRAFLVYRIIVRERRRCNLAASCIQCIHRGYQGRRKAKWAKW